MIGACFLGDIAATTVKIQFVRAVALRELGLRRYCTAKTTLHRPVLWQLPAWPILRRLLDYVAYEFDLVLVVNYSGA